MFVLDDESCQETAAETGGNIDRDCASGFVIPDESRVLAQQLSRAGRPGEVAVQRFIAMGAAAVPVLIDTLASGNRVARENAARALGRIGAAAQAAIPALTRAVQDDHPWVQEEAGRALAEIENAAVDRSDEHMAKGAQDQQSPRECSSGERDECVERRVSHSQQVLRVYARQIHPNPWAMGQNTLADAYTHRTHDDRVENLEQAIDLHRKALQVFTREAYPQLWASVHNSIGEAYRKRSLLGERVKNLGQAITHYQRALEVVTCQNFPELWAAVHNNLGIAYANGAEGDQAENLEQAIHHCQQALEVYTREAYPDDWAMTQNNLGGAYRKRILGERADNIKQAILHFKQALEVQIHQTNREQWAGTHNNLSLAYRDHPGGERAENLEQAIHHCQQALEVYTRDAYPEDWAMLQGRLALLYADRRRGDQAENVEQVIYYAKQALDVFTRDAYPEQWAGIQDFLALVHEYKRSRMNVKTKGSNISLTYPQFYEEESQQQPGKKRKLKLIGSIIPDSKHFTHLMLMYRWDEMLPDEEAKRLGLRAVAYIACAIYDAATTAGLFCQASEIPHGRRPAWYVEGEKVPVSLTLSDINLSERTCQMTIGAVVMAVSAPPSSRTHWEKLQMGFKDRFNEISV